MNYEGKNQGEGNREADRHYRDNTKAFVDSGRVEEAGRDAKEAYESDKEELEAAERQAMKHAEESFDDSTKHLLTREAELRRLRDTLKVRMHLAKKEGQDLFEELEAKWREVEAKLAELRTTSRDKANALSTTAANILDEIRNGYDRLTRSTPSK